jgi:hypothetical protein
MAARVAVVEGGALSFVADSGEPDEASWRVLLFERCNFWLE